MKIFCQDLKDQAMKIINYEKKEMIPVTGKKKETHENKKIVTYVNKNFVQMKMIKKNLNYSKKSEIIVIIQENIEEQHIVSAICATKYQKKVPVVFHNGSTYDYHFIIKLNLKVIFIAWEKILKNTLLYLYQLKKSMTMVKQIKRSMAMVKQLKRSMTMVKQLKRSMEIIKRLKQLYTG